jgi:hypothetical protein
MAQATDSLEKHEASVSLALDLKPVCTIFTGYNDFKNSEGIGGESIIANTSLAWIDLFDIQIDQVIRGNSRADFEFGWEVDKLAYRWEEKARDNQQ